MFIPARLTAGALCSPVLRAGRELTGAVRQPRFAAGSPTCQLSPWASVSASIKLDNKTYFAGLLGGFMITFPQYLLHSRCSTNANDYFWQPQGIVPKACLV